MGINGIGPAGYPLAGYRTGTSQHKAAQKSFANELGNAASAQQKEYIVFLKSEDMLYSGGNGTGLSYYIQYAENSTEEDPLSLIHI